MEINETYIQISGKVPTEYKLENGNAIEFAAEGEVDSVTDKDNKDGTVDRIIKVKTQDIYQINVTNNGTN